MVRNKQFKFSRVFWVQLAQLSLFWFQKCAKIWTAYFWPKIGRSAARKHFFWAWSGCTYFGCFVSKSRDIIKTIISHFSKSWSLQWNKTHIVSELTFNLRTRKLCQSNKVINTIQKFVAYLLSKTIVTLVRTYLCT